MVSTYVAYNDPASFSITNTQLDSEKIYKKNTNIFQHILLFHLAATADGSLPPTTNILETMLIPGTTHLVKDRLIETKNYIDSTSIFTFNVTSIYNGSTIIYRVDNKTSQGQEVRFFSNLVSIITQQILA